MFNQADQPLYEQYGLEKDRVDYKLTLEAVRNGRNVIELFEFKRTPEGHRYWWDFYQDPHQEGYDKLKQILASFPKELAETYKADADSAPEQETETEETPRPGPVKIYMLSSGKDIDAEEKTLPWKFAFNKQILIDTAEESIRKIDAQPVRSPEKTNTHAAETVLFIGYIPRLFPEKGLQKIYRIEEHYVTDKVPDALRT